eukprot:978296-Rhodomonas_salina.2
MQKRASSVQPAPERWCFGVGFPPVCVPVPYRSAGRAACASSVRTPHSAPYARSVERYARAMRCPVLTKRMLLCACYGMPGTDQAYAANHADVNATDKDGSCLRACHAMSGTDLAYRTIYLPACYAMSSTDLAYRTICRRVCYAMSGTDTAYGAMEPLVLRKRVCSTICLRAGDGMSGTYRAYRAICLRVCCAMSGT